MTDALVIGGGPAGLMAAQALAQAGRQVLLVEAKPSPGRKLLMAGKSGLNLTKDEPFEQFLARYGPAGAPLRDIIAGFDKDAVQRWARDLGQGVFTGSSGRVFPDAMKASPLLRAWLGQLNGLGVRLQTGWRWRGWDGDGFCFDTADGAVIERPKTCVLALGGASWSRLGSDGNWASYLAARGVAMRPFEPANAGLVVTWSKHMAPHFGAPLKGVALRAGDLRSRGEFIISSQGLEGGGIYSMTPAIRAEKPLFLDLLPDQELSRIRTRLKGANPKASQSNRLRKALRLDPAKLALLREFAHPLPGADRLADLIKVLPVKHAGLRALDQAISTAGGVAWDALDPGLMLRDIPGVFVAGEMIDWEAPTGGYLLTGCLATGKWAGSAAAKWAAGVG